MNTEEKAKKVKEALLVFQPLLIAGDILKFASLPLDDHGDSEMFMQRIAKTNKKYPHNRCLFILYYENTSLKVDFKIREEESILTIKKNGKIIHRYMETGLGISIAELLIISMYLRGRYLLNQKQTTLKTNIAWEKRTQTSTISQIFTDWWFFLISVLYLRYSNSIKKYRFFILNTLFHILIFISKYVFLSLVFIFWEKIMHTKGNTINEDIETEWTANDTEMIDVFKKRLTRDLTYDRPDGDDWKVIWTPTTIWSKSKKNIKPSRQRYPWD